MIDLQYTRERMLGEIGAAEAGGAIVVRGHTSEDIMPALRDALSSHFTAVAPELLKRDLLAPLKKGIGNACKRGNRSDPSKVVTVEATLAPMGAVVAVSDQGEGFDVRAIVERSSRGEAYYSNHGSGFSRFRKAGSMISYADGGRTLLIRFLSALGPGRPLDEEDLAHFGRAADEETMRVVLSGALRRSGRGPLTIQSLRLSVPEDQKPGGPEISYILSVCRPGSGRSGQTILSARLLGKSEARTDQAVARQLRAAGFNRKDRLQVPRVVAALADPPLTILRLEPPEALRGYLKRTADSVRATSICEMAGRSLRALHESRIDLDVEENLPTTIERYRAAGRFALAALESVDAARAGGVRAIAAALDERLALLGTGPLVTAHGDFGFERVVYAGGRFHFHGFECCRRAHPALDVGAFLADLLRFCHVRHRSDEDLARTGGCGFLESYFAGEVPPWRADLPVFVAGSLLLRLANIFERPGKKWQTRIDPLIEVCQMVLAGRAPWDSPPGQDDAVIAAVV